MTHIIHIRERPELLYDAAAYIWKRWGSGFFEVEE